VATPATGGAKRLILTGISAGLCLLFLALGCWQVARLGWKTALIAQVEARIHAPTVPAPGPDQWSGVTREDDQYRVVSVRGRLLNDRETKVQAVTELGPGSWILTPLFTDDGSTILINRGFVPSRTDQRPEPEWTRPEGPVSVTGLLRLSEPGGGFLRANNPAADRWTSRDVAAIAARRGLGGQTAPYFIDEAATPGEYGWPRGGLTVVRFSNNHLVYALTWFGLAALTAFGAWRFAGAPGLLRRANPRSSEE
jgi:surfeit locus 1 family protein